MTITEEDVKLYTPYLALTRHTGALLWWFQQTYSYRGNPDQLKPVIRSITIKNLLFGWWSITSLIVNPIINIINWVHFSQYKKAYAEYMTDPHGYIVNAKDAKRIAAEKTDKRFKYAMIAFGVLAVILIVLVVIGSN